MLDDQPIPADPLTAGRAELSRGAWKEARAHFEEALRRQETPEAKDWRGQRGQTRRGFFFLPGTAMSPPLGGVLTHVACNVLASGPGKLGKIGVAGLVVHGVLFTVGMLGEPITYKVLNPRTFKFSKFARYRLFSAP